MKKALLAVLASVSSASASAQPVAPPPAPACIARADAEALLLAAMPELLTRVSARCASSLPAGSLLGKGGEALIAPYRDAARDAWPAARPALARLLRARGVPADELDDASARAFLQLGAAMVAGDRLTGASCAVVNETLELLRPLPPAHLARLLALIAQTGQNATAQGRAASLRLCPAR